jgi:pimeloyl-ACP methyl ester carboxylesterase
MSRVLLMHAFPCDSTLWSAQAQSIEAAGFTAVAPDLPGFGGTPLLSGKPDLSVVAQYVLAQLGAEPLHVVGLSLGGYLAMEILRRNPAHIASVCLIDTKAAADTPEAQSRRLEMAETVMDASGHEALVAGMPPQLLGPRTLANRPDLVRRVEHWIRSAPATTIAWYQRAMARRPDSHDVLGSCDVPVTVIWGDADVMSTRQDQDRMLEAKSDAAFRIVRGAGHLSAIEDPDQVSRYLLEHLGASLRHE